MVFTSAFVSWPRTFKKAGILSDTPILSRSSDIKDPRSAIMLSFFAQAKPKQTTTANNLSEIDPGYKLLVKVTAPDGAIPIRPL